MRTDRLAAAVTEVTAMIGEQHVQGQRPADLGEHRPREIRETCFPASTEEVRQAVISAVSTDVPIFPLSTGRNWGLGSRSPVKDGCSVLDLSRMTAIRTLDLNLGYAVVEPGVTQRQLAEHLDGTPWMLNVTAGCADASIVGNTLERGDGTIRPRTEDLLGLEVVLGSGRVMTTGGLDRNGRRPGTVAGPDLTRAFVQSNLGVITAMAIGLIPRPEAITLVHATLAKSVFPEVAEAMIRVGRARTATDGLLRLKDLFVVPEAGRAAIPATVDTDAVTVQVPLLGSRAVVENTEAMICETLSRVSGLLSYRSLDAAETATDDPLFARTQFARGIPSCANVLDGMGVTSCSQVDRSRIGRLMFLPVVPFQPADLNRAIELFEVEAERYGTAGMLEFNVISQHSTNMVTQIPFLRNPSGIERAHELRRAARRSFLRAGFPPYRSDIDNEPWELPDRSSDYCDEPLHMLKRLYDPAAIIAPGRFLVSDR